MEYQSLILGVLLSIGIFAIKSGAGLAYLFSGHRKLYFKITGFLLFSLIYLAIFTAVLLIIKKIDPVTHLVRIQQFIQSGMTIHIIMALFMMIWGVILLRHKQSDHKKSRGWMLLALPCPVCITVIFVSSAFLITIYPDTPFIVISGLYASFMLINIITILLISIYRRSRDIQPESLLGGIMLLIAVYFFLSVTVMPNFSDLDKVYRLAMYKSQKQSQELAYFIPGIFITILAFIIGFFYKFKKITRSLL
ncbi:MAG: DUF2162 family putative transporter [Desulfobacteraceae bacterium]|jgi:predicted transporter